MAIAVHDPTAPPAPVAAPPPSNALPVAVPAAAGPPVVIVQQPVAAAAPAPAQPVVPAHGAAGEVEGLETNELFIYSHSNFFYWWPVWVSGYIMALMTWFEGNKVHVGGDEWVSMSANKNLGVIFTLLFLLVILVTNVTMRGLASVLAILAAAFTVLLLAYLNVWPSLLAWFNGITIYMNMGFYIVISTLIFAAWVFSTFVYDHMNFWRVTPGQVTHDSVIGGLQRSFDARGLVFEKHRADLFRHWIFGLGSGDLQITTAGAKPETMLIPNVLFVDHKIGVIQRLIAMQPER
jgi:hypothetical protein